MVMESSLGHLKALKYYTDGALGYKNHVEIHIDALLALNALYKDLFPVTQSQHLESEALPLIWSDPRGFSQTIEQNRRKIMALKQVAVDDMAALKRAVNEVRKSCGDCHSYYKER